MKVVNSSHVLATDVANAAIALVLALTRDIVQADRFVREGKWLTERHGLGRSVSQMKIGIVGLGMIGAAVARRLHALEAAVCYYSPRRKTSDFAHYDDLTAMASECDVLVLTCPLNDETFHLIDAGILKALGPRGYVVNLARGAVIDEQALVQALAAGEICGAALDVFENEPNVPEALINDTRVVLTPHIGSATEETRRGMANHVVDGVGSAFRHRVQARILGAD